MSNTYKILLAGLALVILSFAAAYSVNEQPTFVGKVLSILMFTASYSFLLALLLNAEKPERKQS